MFNLRNFIVDIDSVSDNLFSTYRVSVSMLRLDKIHPIVSGNKIFKLFLFLEEAKKSTHKKIITFGGAYSNHLAATAFASKQAGLQAIGIVRGEKPTILSNTLLYCLDNNMQLEFISRDLFKKNNVLKDSGEEKKFHQQLIDKYGDHTLIPEGGFSIKGKKGVELICNYYNEKKITHVCSSVGTATTLAGLINAGGVETQVIGFNALKNLNDISERLKFLQIPISKKYSIINDYHFGGYAKKDASLISFMNTFYSNNKIPLDFVYTGKMMFGVFDLIRKNYFPENANILCIHTGGLLGNKSLPEGLLNF